MMTCTQVADLLFDYCEGDIDEHTSTTIEQHLDACEECDRLVRTYSAVGGLVRDALLQPLPPELQETLDEDVLRALAQERRSAAGG
jgi:anti-sigma factor RsiW